MEKCTAQEIRNPRHLGEKLYEDEQSTISNNKFLYFTPENTQRFNDYGSDGAGKMKKKVKYGERKLGR